MDTYYPGNPIEVDSFVWVHESKLAKGASEGDATFTVYDASRWAATNVLKIGKGDPQRGPSQIITIGSINAATNVVTISGGSLLYPFTRGTQVRRIADSTLAGTAETPTGLGTVTWSNISTGRYRGTVIPTTAGGHEIEAASTGAVVGAGVIRFDVERDLVG